MLFNVKTFYLKPDSAFSSFIREWASSCDLATEDYDIRKAEHTADGLLVITENQDIDKDLYELHTLFDLKHIPTQKVDINGTLQVAVSSTDLWIKSNKCQSILVVGAENLVNNENLSRFLSRIKQPIVKAL